MTHSERVQSAKQAFEEGKKRAEEVLAFDAKAKRLVVMDANDAARRSDVVVLNAKDAEMSS